MDALDLIAHVNYNGGKQVDYAYNKTGDLVKMEDWSGTTYEYDGMRRVTRMNYPDGWQEDYHYDSS